MQSRLFSVRVLTVVITAGALSLGWVACGPAALPATAGTAVTAAAALQDPSAPGTVVTVPPARLADSRIGQQLSGPLPAQGSGAVQITGHAGVPATGVDAAVLTVTAVSPRAAGYLTVWPTGAARTNTSNLNFPAGQTIATTVITPLGPDGRVQIFNGSAGFTDLVVDVSGYTRSGNPGTVARTPDCIAGTATPATAATAQEPWAHPDRGRRRRTRRQTFSPAPSQQTPRPAAESIGRARCAKVPPGRHTRTVPEARPTHAPPPKAYQPPPAPRCAGRRRLIRRPPKGFGQRLPFLRGHTAHRLAT